MRRFGLFLVTLAAVGLVWGCGDDDDNGTGNGPTEPSRLVVNTTVGAPSVSNPDATVWNSVDSITLAVGTSDEFTPKPTGTASVPADIKVQAIEDAGELYLRVRWGDPTLSAWYGHWYVTDATDIIDFAAESLEPLQTTYLEDQLLVMFSDGGESWDSWNWRVLTAGAAGLAEGVNVDWALSSAVSDAEGTPGVTPAVENDTTFTQPTYLPKDTSAFSGYIFHLADTVRSNDTLRIDYDTTFVGAPVETLVDTNYITYRMTTGWDMDQRIPRFMADTSTASENPTTRGSRWDIHCGDQHDGTGYTVVMQRSLTTGFEDDLAMGGLDSVQVKLAVYDNDIRLFGASNQNRGFTRTFWLIF